MGNVLSKIQKVPRKFRRLLTLLNPRRVWRTAAWFGGIAGEIRRRRQEKRLTVGVDIGAFGDTLTGIGWYLLRTLEALAERDDVRLRLYGPFLVAGQGYDEALQTQPPKGAALEFVRTRPPEDLSIAPWTLAKVVQKAQKFLIALDRNQVLFAPNYLIPPHFRRAARSGGRVVSTVHDLGFLKVPWSLDEHTFGALEQRLEETFAQSRRIMTDSLAVREELVEMGRVPPDRIVAVPLGPGQLAGAETTPGTPPEGTPEHYALHVGTIEPRKNLKVLLAAWQQLRETGYPAPALVLCGKMGWKSEGLEAAMEQGEADGWLRRFGYVDNPQLAALYRGAWCVVFPTLYEGFGLPAVEAQGLGVPLLASDIPVLREVAGDGALYAPPEDPQAWVASIRRLAEEEGLRDRLIAAGHENVRRFTWGKVAESMMTVFREVAED
jgi:glycosyltransferase involved in cell wall biosynthesis